MFSLMAPSAFGLGQVATTKEIAPNSEVRPSGVEDRPEKEQPSSPVEPPAEIAGFRQAQFGMSEEQVRQAIRKDFPAAAAKLTSLVHPSEKTIVLSLSVADLLPHTGNARISYILGYRSRRLSQVNMIWAIDGTTIGDETVVGIANSLREYFSSENFKPDSVIINHQLAENTIIVFRGSDNQERTLLLLLSGVVASAQLEGKKGPKMPPLTLELSYIQNAAHPDVFRIGKGPVLMPRIGPVLRQSVLSA
jgi:hypothetical protein